MKTLKMTIAAGLALASTAALAAGPLYLWEGGAEPVPYKWNTSNGPIPVYTDGGEAFAFDYDGVTPFITIERANEIVQYAFDQWNNVPTSTFEAQIAGTYAEITNGAITDITGENATEVYDVENGYGFWVNFDTDGSILEDYFGVSSTAVLGIAFPEWADESTGEITEAVAVLNGVAIWDQDFYGNELAGVFTHEFGHALNMSHTQVNGPMFYAPTYANRQAGPRNCGPFPAKSSFEEIETMFPYLSVHQAGPGQAQSTINLTDDIVAISNLYPTADYATTKGSISGVLRLKDGSTEYSGINVIARNINNWYGDAVSAMSGDQTQGLVGPDGHYTINGLTPGEQYVLYIEEIWSGGYPTTPTRIVSQAEYWNAAESNDPGLDDICESTPIVAEAGVTKTADITFNGYETGIQYTPIVSAYLVDLAKNGKASAGQVGSTGFKWDAIHGFAIFPAGVKASNISMTRNGQTMNVQFDDNGNGINQAALATFNGKSGKFELTLLGDLNGDSCGNSSTSGVSSSYGWAVDDTAHTVVGTAYVDNDGNGTCTTTYKNEIVPFIWTDGKKGGMRQLSVEGKTSSSWVRAHAISGNGQVVLGNNGGSRAVAWVNEGPMIDLYSGPYKTRDAYAVNYDGSRVALDTYSNGPVLWNPYDDVYTEMGSLEWCTVVPFFHIRYGDLCAPGNRICPAGCTPEELEAMAGPASILASDMNDAGTVIIGRAGSFAGGFIGAVWVEGLGWMTLKDMFEKQGVSEALDFPMENPISIDGKGNKLVGGLVGATMSWYVDITKVFVCENGKSVQTPFPEGMIEHLQNGAEFGRCEMIH